MCSYWKVPLLVVLFFTAETFFGASGQTAVDPLANVSTPLRETMRNKHANVTITVQVLDFQSPYMSAKLANFRELTGARVNEIEITQASWFADIQEDMNGAGFVDLYAIFGNWIPTFAEQGGLADVTDGVSEAVGLDWFDIMPAVRSGVASYLGKLYTVPLDGDCIVMLYRTDLVEGAGLPTPKTWDDVLTITEYYADTDFTGDGIPDYSNCFSTKTDDIAGTIFWSVASSFLQTRGTSQGTFFDPETFDPKSTDPDFLRVLNLYSKLVEQSPFRDSGPSDWQDNLVHFEAGRCVLWYNYPGPTRILVSNQEINNMTGVLNYAPLPGMKCEDKTRCPFVSDDGANHAPFLASGGFTYAVNSRSPERERNAALDFIFYISDPAVGYWDVAYPGSFLDPLRQRHTVALSNPESPEAQTFLGFGWEERQLPMLKGVTEFNFLSDNYVKDLRILGAIEYQEAGTVPHLVEMWSGRATDTQTAEAITASWRAVTDKYGLSEQRDMYRQTLGLPPYEPPDSQNGGRVRLEIIIPVSVAVFLILLVLVLVVLKQHRHIKYKTRCVANAPVSGQIAVVFTDIEGSTRLWDASKSVMSKALEIHHDTIRRCIQEHGAYEVKTIGDAFMIAVGCADEAVSLANDIQACLLDADWPIELASMPSSTTAFYPAKGRSRAPPKPMFRGVRVRIGLHVGEHSDKNEGGEIQVKYDKVTKGYDYYGPAINTAARVEELAFGGQTIISSSVLERLTENVKDECAFSLMGTLELRGVSEKVTLHQCLPIGLRGRRFQGVIRRRNSEGTDIVPDDDPSMRLGDSVHSDIDREVDVMSLTPVQLQSTVMRLRNRLSALEKQNHGCSNPQSEECINSDVLNNGGPLRRSVSWQ